MRIAATIAILVFFSGFGSATQCFTVPTPSGNEFLQLSLRTRDRDDDDVICRYALAFPFNTEDSLSPGSTVILQLLQPSLRICCSSCSNTYYSLEASNHPYRIEPNGHIRFNDTLVTDVTLPFTAYLRIINEADFNLEIFPLKPTTLRVANHSFSGDCGLLNPYLSIYQAVGGGQLLDVPFSGEVNLSAQDRRFALSILPTTPTCTANVKLTVTSTTFYAPPSSCLTVQPFSVENCTIPCGDDDAFICIPFTEAVLNVFSPIHGNVSVTVTQTSIYPIQCFADGKQVATEGEEEGWFVAAAGSTTAITCSTVGAIQYQPPYPTYQIQTKYVPFVV